MWYALTGAVMFTGTVPQVMAQQMDRPPLWGAARSPAAGTRFAASEKCWPKIASNGRAIPIELRGMIEFCLHAIPVNASPTRLQNVGLVADPTEKFEVPDDPTVVMQTAPAKSGTVPAKRLDLSAQVAQQPPAAPPPAPVVQLDGPSPDSGVLVARRYKIGHRLMAHPPGEPISPRTWPPATRWRCATLNQRGRENRAPASHSWNAWNASKPSLTRTF